MSDLSHYAEWEIAAHKERKANFETRTCPPDDCEYRIGFHPFQVVVIAAGWKARLLAWLFRIPPCKYTGTNEICWPKPDLLK